MASETDIAVVREAIEAFGRRDLDRLMACLADDVAWETPGAGVLAGSYHGRVDLRGVRGRQGPVRCPARALRAHKARRRARRACRSSRAADGAGMWQTRAAE